MATTAQTDADLFKEYEQRSIETPWLTYPITAVPAIVPWHKAKNKYCVLSGANDIGKTTAGAARLVACATGFDPFTLETWPTPNVCWGVCVEYKSAGRVMFKKLAEMLPRTPSGDRAWTYYKQDHIILLHAPYNSEIHIKSQKEGESSLLGERCTAIWVDEAMGGEVGLENFGELQARELPDQPLKMFFTLTPKMDTGIEWMRRKLWVEPGETPHEDFLGDVFCHRVDFEDCSIEKGGYLSPIIIESKKKDTDPMEAAARLHGAWTPFFTRPAFSYKHLLKAAENAPQGRFGRFRTSLSTSRLEFCDASPCKIFKEKESGHSYIAFWDPSSGMGRGHDNSALWVLDRGTMEEVCHVRANDIRPDEYAHNWAIPIARYYNSALLAVENNGEGGAAAVGALRGSYDNLYHQQNYLKQTATFTENIGWRTTEQSRGRMMDALKKALEEGKCVFSKDLIEEMGHMVVKMVGAKRRIEAADGYHDDLALAAAGALAIHFEEPLYEWPDFAKLRVRYGGTPYTHIGPLMRG